VAKILQISLPWQRESMMVDLGY